MIIFTYFMLVVRYITHGIVMGLGWLLACSSISEFFLNCSLEPVRLHALCDSQFLLERHH